MVSKHLIACSLAVPGNLLHGSGEGIKGIIWSSPHRQSPGYRWGGPLVPCRGGLDAIQSFHVAEPGPIRAGHDKW